MKIVFMGTPDFAVKQADKLLEAGYSMALVVTQPDRKGNRGKIQESPVKKWAKEKGLDLSQPSKLRGNSEFEDLIRDIRPDLIVVSAYGSILPKEILEIPEYGCINVHASLLPKYRGASPIQQAILNGDEEAGVSIMQMEEGLDTGPVFAQSKIKVGDMDYPQLDQALSELGADLVVDTVKKIFDCDIKAKPQDDEEASYAGMIKKQDGLISFDRNTADDVERKIRAFRPWPGVSFISEGKKIKIWEAVAIDDDTYFSGQGKYMSETGSCEAGEYRGSKPVPGQILKTSEEGIDIACSDGVIRVRELQIPGKKRTDAGSYLRGHKLLPGTVIR